MSATTRDLFGNASTAEPATPGSYGEAPSGFRLPAGISLGPVRLQVAEIGRSLDYYRRILGLHVLADEESAVVLGVEGGNAGGPTPLVELRQRQGARPSPARGRLGLFHFAILLPDRASLARFILHLEGLGVHAGAGDHLVSEAFYLQDPDGLGIEVYADRPRHTWQRIGRELMMATDPVDIDGLVPEAQGSAWSGMPEGAKMGHVHLHVGDLRQASRFYSEGLGFDRTVWSYPGALFLGAGGYHHHLGTNLWAGPSARPAAEDEAQLLEWTLEVPEPASLRNAMESLESSGYTGAPLEDGAELLLRDPWGTAVRLRCHGRG